jgi:methylated-DNA-[protein]-cysteine S-methyltransferase
LFGAVPSPEQSDRVRSSALEHLHIYPVLEHESGFRCVDPRVTLFFMNSPAVIQHFSTTLDSPVGALSVLATDRALVALAWRREVHSAAFEGAIEKPRHPLLLETARQLREYFGGKRRQFEIELDFRGTDFQRRVWAALLTVPYGETRTYRQIAEQVGNATAVRAVGAANGRNPISIIAPCHRVIGMNGDLTGFGGGLDAKARLLSLEAPQRQLLAG